MITAAFKKAAVFIPPAHTTTIDENDISIPSGFFAAIDPFFLIAIIPYGNNLQKAIVSEEKMKKIVLTLCSLLFLAACGGAQETGELQFVANGEDFVRQGFVSKDGWQIDFQNVFVTLSDVQAYQTDPPYNASTGDAPEGETVAAGDVFTIDLAEGGADAAPILFASATEAPTGQYNAISWDMVNATDGPSAGNTLMLVGTAVKDGETVNFTLSIPEEFSYSCGEFVGDARKGFLTESGDVADVELTFHFDHVFGDGDSPADDSLNVGALGFDPLAAVATNGELNASLADLEGSLAADEFATLVDTLQTLGHVGEGHCYEATGGYTDKEG